MKQDHTCRVCGPLGIPRKARTWLHSISSGAGDRYLVRSEREEGGGGGGDLFSRPGRAALVDGPPAMGEALPCALVARHLHGRCVRPRPVSTVRSKTDEHAHTHVQMYGCMSVIHSCSSASLYSCKYHCVFYSFLSIPSNILSKGLPVAWVVSISSFKQ